MTRGAADREPAPLFSDAFALSTWLIEQLGTDGQVLSQRLCNASLDLLSSVTLALKGRDRELRIDEADETLCTLRIELRLAAAVGRLTEEQLLHVLEIADRIGRQLGGWQRSLDAP